MTILLEDLQVREEPIETLAEHASVSISFEIDRIFEVIPLKQGLGGFSLLERHANPPTRKDYDSIVGEAPSDWPNRFDVSHWGLLVARHSGQRIGGAVIAWGSDNPGVFDGRRDLAVLWDIRVDPLFRGQGVGSALFRSAEDWARARGCIQLRVETQNTNVAACEFYVGRGCRLGAINCFAYTQFPNEAQLLWYKNLAPEPT